MMIKTKHKIKSKSTKRSKATLSNSEILKRLKHMRKHYIGEVECLNELIKDLSVK